MSEVVYHPPVPCNASAKAIADFAEGLREESNLKTGFDLINLIKINGGHVEDIAVLDDNQEDALIVNPDGSFTVRVSQLSSGLRNNFIIAHELGHYVMHWPKLKEQNPDAAMKCPRATPEDTSGTTCDIEANAFAMSFLMPEQEFREVVSERGLEYAATKFAVTLHIAKRRAEKLDIELELAEPTP